MKPEKLWKRANAITKDWKNCLQEYVRSHIVFESIEKMISFDTKVEALNHSIKNKSVKRRMGDTRRAEVVTATTRSGSSDGRTQLTVETG